METIAYDGTHEDAAIREAYAFWQSAQQAHRSARQACDEYAEGVRQARALADPGNPWSYFTPMARKDYLKKCLERSTLSPDLRASTQEELATLSADLAHSTNTINSLGAAAREAATLEHAALTRWSTLCSAWEKEHKPLGEPLFTEYLSLGIPIHTRVVRYFNSFDSAPLNP